MSGDGFWFTFILFCSVIFWCFPCVLQSTPVTFGIRKVVFKNMCMGCGEDGIFCKTL